MTKFKNRLDDAERATLDDLKATLMDADRNGTPEAYKAADDAFWAYVDYLLAKYYAIGAASA